MPCVLRRRVAGNKENKMSAPQYKLPASLINFMRFDGGLKEHHRSYQFLISILEYQHARGFITARQRAAVVKTCRRFGYDPSPQIERL